MRRQTRYPLAVVGLVLASFLLRGVTEQLVEGVVDGGVPAFGTVGQTVTAFLLVVSVFTLVVVPAASFWLGYRYRRAVAAMSER